MWPIAAFEKHNTIKLNYRFESLGLKKLVKEVGDMIRVKKVSVFVSAFIVASMLLGAGLVSGAFAHEVEVVVEEVEVEVIECTSQEGVPCTQMCGPSVVNEFKAGGAVYTEMSQSRQVNMLSATSIDFTAPCIQGSKAVSGGYVFLPDGSTIDMDEIRITSQRPQNDIASLNSSWLVSIYREHSGNVDNCLNVEVRALCVKE